MKNVYELITIFAPQIIEEKMQTHLKKIKDIISSFNGNIVSEDLWGNKKLAYKIKKFSNGIYHYMKFHMLPTGTTEIKKYVSANEEIIRYSLIKIKEKTKENELRADTTVSELPTS